MHGPAEANPSLIVAIALAAGMIAQALARHLRVPGIVILLGVGILLGPDGIGIVKPHDLGVGLHLLVQFAIAIILFEGGLNLEWRRLRGQAATIRSLVTLGAVITWLGGTLAVHYIAGWDWRLSVLFGSLVIVTGPTVITPLLRRIRVNRQIETILEAEGVFIDAVGALIAVVTIEVVLQFSGSTLALGFVSLPTRLVVGLGVGLAGGFVVAWLLRIRGVVPEGFENVFTLSLALVTFQISSSIVAASGIVAVIVLGMVLANMRLNVKQELKEFKEQLTVMLIGMLFVLLAADVRLADVRSLGMAGVFVVITLMVVVRPITVFACTTRAGLNWREKTFISWMGPRGIIAAAVASLFYDRMEQLEMPGGAQMRALVFLVIATTVVVQGGTGGFIARALGVKRKSGKGYVILGAHHLARLLARLLRDGGEDVVLVDANPENCKQAEADGFRVLHGNALEERVMVSAELDTRNAVLAMLPNAGVNLLFAQKAYNEYGAPRWYSTVPRQPAGVSAEMVNKAGGRVLFASEVDVEQWDVRVRREIVSVWRMALADGDAYEKEEIPREMRNVVLPLTHVSGGLVVPFGTGGASVKEGDRVDWLVLDERAAMAETFLRDTGWLRDNGEEDAPGHEE